MPKKEKVFIGVASGIIIILFAVFGYAYAKKIWFFSGATSNEISEITGQDDLINCGNLQIYRSRLEGMITSQFNLEATGETCSAKGRWARYETSQTPRGECYIEIDVDGESLKWINPGPNCRWDHDDLYEDDKEYKLGYGEGNNYRLKKEKIPEDATSVKDGYGIVSEQIKQLYSDLQTIVGRNHDVCCAVETPTAQPSVTATVSAD